MYRYLLADNDNTLMDFDLAERRALTETFEWLGLPADEAVCSLYHDINDALWKALERGEITQAALKTERFARLLTRLGRTDLAPADVAERYAARLSTHAELLPGALALLEALHGRMKIALISNGVSAIQRGRLGRSPILPLLDAVIISEEVGVRKPDPRMIDIALDVLSCADRREAVLLGDSLTADIPAAVAAGIDSVYLNLLGQASDLPTYTVTSLDEARLLLTRESRPADESRA